MAGARLQRNKRVQHRQGKYASEQRAQIASRCKGKRKKDYLELHAAHKTDIALKK